MNPIVVAAISIGIPIAALVLHVVQTSLERWDQRRHADD